MVITGVKLLLQIICNACPLRCNQKGFIYSIYQFWSCFGYLLLFLCWGCARSLWLQKQKALPSSPFNRLKKPWTVSCSMLSFSDLLLKCGSLVCTCNTHQFQVVCILSCIHIGLFDLQNHAKSGCVQHSAIYTKRKVMMCKKMHKNILKMVSFPQGFVLPVVLPCPALTCLLLAVSFAKLV